MSRPELEILLTPGAPPPERRKAARRGEFMWVEDRLYAWARERESGGWSQRGIAAAAMERAISIERLGVWIPSTAPPERDWSAEVAATEAAMILLGQRLSHYHAAVDMRYRTGAHRPRAVQAQLCGLGAPTFEGYVKMGLVWLSAKLRA